MERLRRENLVLWAEIVIMTIGLLSLMGTGCATTNMNTDLSCIIFLIIVLMIFNVADVFTTIHVLKKGGREQNPIIRAIIKKFGLVKGLIVGKACLISPVIIIAVLYPGITMTIILIILDGLYGWIIKHNIDEISKEN